MKIRMILFGHEECVFDSSDSEMLNQMIADLKRNSDAAQYETLDGVLILRWPMDSGDEDDEHHYTDTREYSAACPWNALGMRPEDFIR